jgi:hypothetical protein
MNKYSDPDPGSGIKHPGSATLRDTIPLKKKNIYVGLHRCWRELCKVLIIQYRYNTAAMAAHVWNFSESGINTQKTGYKMYLPGCQHEVGVLVEHLEPSPDRE